MENVENQAPMVSVAADSKAEEQKNDRPLSKQVYSWFNPKVQEAKKKKEKRLFLTTCESQKLFEDTKSIFDADALHVKVTNLRLENKELVKGLEEYVSHIKEVQSVNFEFLDFKKQDISMHENFSAQLEGLINAVFNRHRTVEKIKVSWKHAKGADILLKLISGKFFDLKGSLKKFSFTFNGKISCKEFCDFIKTVRLLEGNMTAFKIKGDLQQPEGLNDEITKPLEMTKGTKFCLNLTCSGSFGDELVKFAIGSLECMKSINDLRIELTMEDFTENNSQELMKELIENVAKINGNMEAFFGILCLGKSDVNVFKKFVEAAVKGMKIIKLKELKLGTHPKDSDKLLELKTQKAIKEYWTKKTKEMEGANN